MFEQHPPYASQGHSHLFHSTNHASAHARIPSALLLADTDSPAPPASRLAVLTTHPQAPVVPQTPVRADLLETLQILTKLRVDAVGKDLLVFAGHDVALTVEEPGRDLVLGRILDDGDDALEFFGSELTGAEAMSVAAELVVLLRRRDVPLVEVHVRLLADQVAVAATNTLDLGQGVHDLLLAIDLQ